MFRQAAAGKIAAMSALSTVATRVRGLLGEVVRFLAVGGLATAVSVVGFNALVHGMFGGWAPLHDQPIPAYVLVNVLAGWVAYVGMRVWTFRHRDVRDPVAGMVRFFALGALTMAIPVLCLWVSRYGLGLTTPLADNLAANVVGLGLGAAARFWVFRRYVFEQVPAEPWSPPA